MGASTDTVVDDVAPAPAPARLRRGDAIGRFVVLDELGLGAMGIVYAAYDPDLDRKVAIKLLRGSAADGPTRLLREAQAMAKINHPNVVTVHEVGTFGAQVYLAMEFAEGGTLRGWLDAADRPQRDILDRFVQAGRGLEAAHASDLVHRDFKPDNVLVAKDGSVRVTDFGIVSLAPSGVPIDGSSQDLTRTGALMGTPAYMAPEQFAGTATAKSDQFSFCVALYEALYKAKPFRGDNMMELAANISTGELAPLPNRVAVPASLRRVLMRGLSVDPAARFPSMHALLAALAGRRRPWRYAVGAAVLAGVTLAIASMLSSSADPCTGDERADAVWNPERRVAMKAAFDASKRPFAAASFVRASLLVDAWTAHWQLGSVAACRDAGAHPGDELAERRARCLDEALAGTRAIVDGVIAGDATAIDHAVDALAQVPSPAVCADRDFLALQQPLATPAAATQRSQIAAMVAVARARWRLGDLRGARAMFETTLVTARALGDLETLARTEAYAAWLAIELDRGDALAMLHVALSDATAAGATTLQIEIITSMVYSFADDPKRYDALAELGVLGEATARRLGVPVVTRKALDVALGVLAREQGDLQRAHHYLDGVAAALTREAPDSTDAIRALQATAALALAEGRIDDARRDYEHALDIVARRDGVDTPPYAEALDNLGIAARRAGHFDDAERYYNRALAIHHAIYGDASLAVAETLNNLGSLELSRGDSRRARAYLERALDSYRSIGADELTMSGSVANLADAYRLLGDFDKARDLIEQTVRTYERSYGPQNPLLVDSLMEAGVIAQAQQRLDEARAIDERALALAQRAYGPDHPDTIDIMNNLGDVFEAQKHYDEAEALYKRAIASAEKRFGSGDLHVATTLVSLGHLDVDRGRAGEALAIYDRARTIFEATVGPSHYYTAAALAGTGGALVELHREREAIPVLERAIAIMEKAAPADDLAEAKRLLARARAR